MSYVATDLVRAVLYAHYLEGTSVAFNSWSIRCEETCVKLYMLGECKSSAKYIDIDDSYVRTFWKFLRMALRGDLTICYKADAMLRSIPKRSDMRITQVYDVEDAQLRIFTLKDANGKNRLITPIYEPRVACILNSALHEKDMSGYSKTYLRDGWESKFVRVTEDRAESSEVFCMFYPYTTTASNAVHDLFSPVEDEMSTSDTPSDDAANTHSTDAVEIAKTDKQEPHE